MLKSFFKIAWRNLLKNRQFTFLNLLGLSTGLASALLITNQWLHGFSYRIDISPGIFITAGASIILITLFTISFQAVKAAVANPVRSLRSE